jgi:hypothetical protein
MIHLCLAWTALDVDTHPRFTEACQDVEIPAFVSQTSKEAV